MEFTKNELNLIRYAVEDLFINRSRNLGGELIFTPTNAASKFEEHVNEIMHKIDWMLCS